MISSSSPSQRHCLKKIDHYDPIYRPCWRAPHKHALTPAQHHAMRRNTHARDSKDGRCMCMMHAVGCRASSAARSGRHPLGSRHDAATRHRRLRHAAGRCQLVPPNGLEAVCLLRLTPISSQRHGLVTLFISSCFLNIFARIMIYVTIVAFSLVKRRFAVYDI